MLRIRNETSGPIGRPDLALGDDLDLDGAVDIGTTTTLQGEPHAPAGFVSQFFYRGTGCGDQFRADYHKLNDDGIQSALKYLGE